MEIPDLNWRVVDNYYARLQAQAQIERTLHALKHRVEESTNPGPIVGKMVRLRKLHKQLSLLFPAR